MPFTSVVHRFLVVSTTPAAHALSFPERAHLVKASPAALQQLGAATFSDRNEHAPVASESRRSTVPVHALEASKATGLSSPGPRRRDSASIAAAGVEGSFSGHHYVLGPERSVPYESKPLG